MQIDLTIIIPCYNVEKFILNALNSIINQNKHFLNYEVLIVDDGSKDRSFELTKHFIEKNNIKNFKLIKKTNGNWGSVINYVKNNNLINGKYVTILDADDLFNKNCFESIQNKLNGKNDLVLTNFFRQNSFNNKLKKTKVIYSKTGIIDKKRSFTAWSIPLCKFFKSSLFLEMEDLKENVSYQDQILFHSFVLKKAENIYFINKNLGIYFENRDGSSTSLEWNEKRIKLWCSNMDFLLSLNSKQINAYVMLMINHCKNKAPKNLKYLVKIKTEYIKEFKRAKFTWLNFGLRWFAKLVFTFATMRILKNSKNF